MKTKVILQILTPIATTIAWFVFFYAFAILSGIIAELTGSSAFLYFTLQIDIFNINEPATVLFWILNILTAIIFELIIVNVKDKDLK